jgi:drug/metabolite transporter (DMT)-like permease
MARQNGEMNRRALAMFLGLGFAWGIPYLLIKVAVEEISPSQLVLSRTAIAAVLLLPLAFARGLVLPTLRRWKPVLAFAVIEIALPWVALGRAEQKLHSSTTALLIAAVPLVGLGVAFVSGRAERLSATAWLGLALGIAGVAALVGLDIGGSQWDAVAEVGVTVVGYAVGPAILARSLSDLSGLGVMAVSLTITALIYVPVVLIGDGVPTGLPSGDVIASVLVLASVCTAAAFLLMFGLVNEVGPVRATTITYINPAVAVVAGVIVLSEPVTVWTIVGFVLVVAGSFLVNSRPRAQVADCDVPPVAEPATTSG